MDVELDAFVRVHKELTPPEGRTYWTSPQKEGQLPIFNAREVAAIFYARKKMWMWLRLTNYRDRYPMDLPEIPRNKNDFYQFQLHHVELLSHVFLENGIIDLNTFRNAITIIKAIARNYRLMKGDLWQEQQS